MYLILTEDGNVMVKPVPLKSKGKNKEVDTNEFVDYLRWRLGGEFEELDIPCFPERVANVKMLAGHRKASKENMVASFIYGAGLHGSSIFGDAVLIFEPVDENTNERRIKPMDAEQIRVLLNGVKEVHDIYYPDNDEYDIWA